MTDLISKKSCFLIGEDRLLIQCAKVLLSKNYLIMGVVSPLSEVKEWALNNQVRYFKSFTVAKKLLLQKRIDYLFSIVNHEILPLSFLNQVTQFAINYHDAPLPRYAGPNATGWAIINNEKSHGVTWHLIQEMIDGGDILKQITFTIDEDETALSLNLKCYQHALTLFSELVDELSKGEFYPQKQDLSKRTYHSLSTKPKGNGFICWNESAEKIDREFRAYNVGNYDNILSTSKFILGSDVYIVDDLTQTNEVSTKPAGTIVELNDFSWKIATATKNLILLSVKTLDGEACSLPEITQHYNLSLDYQLLLLTQQARQSFEEASSKYFKHEAFWVDQLKNIKPSDFPFLPNLPTKNIIANSYCPVHAFDLSESTLVALKKMSQNEDLIYAVILTLWLVYLYRLGNRESIGIALKNTDLSQEEMGINNVFANEMPFSVVIKDDMSFTQCLKMVIDHISIIKQKKTYLKDIVYRYQGLSSTVSTIALAVAMGEDETIEILSNSLLYLRISNDARKLNWYVASSVLEKNSNLFQTLSNIPIHFQVLVNSVIKNPEQAIKAITFVSSAEKDLILSEWNKTSVNYPKATLISTLIEQQAKKYPQEKIIFYEGVSITYQELHEQASQLANYLQNKVGIKRQQFITVFMHRSIELIITILGILKVGAVYVPISSNTPIARAKAIIKDVNTALLITHTLFIEKIATINAKEVNILCLDQHWTKILNESKTSPLEQAKHNDIAYTIYTSGTTGVPKGVTIKNTSLVNLAIEQIKKLGLTSKSKVLQFASISFDASIWEIFSALMAGSKLFIPSEKYVLIGETLSHHINKDEINIITLPPSILQTISPYNMPSLTTVVTAGEPCSKELANYWSSKVCLINAYGPTETTVCATMGVINNNIINNLSIGKPIANTTVYVLDENLIMVPVGVVGELYIGGDGVSAGYLNQEELTNKFFIPNFLSENKNEKLYKTRDLVRWLPDGSLEYIGRIDNQIKIRGFRIDPEAIEEQILQDEDILQCVVSSKHNERLGGFLVAYIVAEKAQVNINKLRQIMRKTLPDYMIPSFFVFLGKLPLTDNGKVDRNSLPAPDVSKHGNTNYYMPPQTQTEKKLVKLWEDLFSIERIGIHDNFFDLGGNSLLLSQLILILKDNFNIEMRFTAFINNPTISFLADLIIKNFKSITQTNINPWILQDTCLDQNIKPNKAFKGEKRGKAALLTGVTGFLGSYLLKDLYQNSHSKIYCLVRAKTNAEAKKLIEKSIAAYNFSFSLDTRIIPIAGDLSCPQLGLNNSYFHFLAEEIDTIYHNAAYVHHVYGYDMLRATNVLGTIELLKLAFLIKTKSFHYISTLSAVLEHLDNDNNIIEDYINSNSGGNSIVDGYSQTKWVSERLISQAAERGLPVNIYRPGWILGTTTTYGDSIKNNHLYLLIKGCIQMGYAPDWKVNLSILPVGFVSELISKISLSSEINAKVFNFSNDSFITWLELIKCLNEFGYDIELLDSKVWTNNYLKKINNDNALFQLLPLYINSHVDWVYNMSNIYSAKDVNTKTAMRKLDLTYPQINKKLLFKFFSVLQSECFSEELDLKVK